MRLKEKWRQTTLPSTAIVTVATKANAAMTVTAKPKYHQYCPIISFRALTLLKLTHRYELSDRRLSKSLLHMAWPLSRTNVWILCGYIKRELSLHVITAAVSPLIKATHSNIIGSVWS